MSRKFYACKCLFKSGIKGISQNFGKVVFVFKSLKERNEFVSSKNNENSYFAITQKEAFNVTNLNKSNSVACVYHHPQDRELFVLSDIKQCYGDKYYKLTEFN